MPDVLVMGAAIIRHGRVLAARRTVPADADGGWEFPGGKVEPGESPLEAVHREVREELGIGIELGRHVEGPLPGGAWPLGELYELYVWLAEVVDGTPAPIEDHDELRWLPIDDLYAVPWLPADRPIVELLESMFRSGTDDAVVKDTPKS